MTDNEKPSFINIFLVCIWPFWILLTFLVIEYGYFYGQSNAIITDWKNQKPQISNIVSKYSDRFTPQEINSTKYGNISFKVSQTALSIIEKIKYEIIISFGILLGIGHLFCFLRTRELNTGYDQIKFQHYVTSGLTISSSISASVSVGITLIGAVSLLSPNIVGGYLISGLQVLLMCIVVGIVTHMFGADVIEDVIDPQKNRVKLKRRPGTHWEGLISSQFVLLILGISLLISQMVFFPR